MSLQGILLLLFAIYSAAMTPRLESQNVAEQYLLAAANDDRQKAGLPSLRTDGILAQAALVHARVMASHETISHRFPGELDLATRAEAAGARFSLITENVAEAPTPIKVHELWMQSAGHRANLLDPTVDAVGIAVVSLHGQLYAVEDFARIVQHLSIVEQEDRVNGLLANTGLHLSEDRADARQTCVMKSGFAGQRQPWFVMRYTTSTLNQLPDQLLSRLATKRFHEASVGACVTENGSPFTAYSIAVLLYP